MWWVLAGCAQRVEFTQGPPAEEGVGPVCRGTGERDHGDDGTIDRYEVRDLGESWEESTSWDVGSPLYQERLRTDRDERGDPVLEVWRIEDVIGWVEQVRQWERDGEGRELAYTEETTTDIEDLGYPVPGVLRSESTWDGDRLDLVTWFADGDEVAVVGYAYDTDGRLVETVTDTEWSHRVDARVYYAPAPSLDHRATIEDGGTRAWGDRWYDDDGRIVSFATVSEAWDATIVTTGATTYDGAGRPTRETTTSLWNGTGGTTWDSATAWDDHGHELEEVVTGPAGTDRTTWTWDCE